MKNRYQIHTIALLLTLSPLTSFGDDIQSAEEIKQQLSKPLTRSITRSVRRGFSIQEDGKVRSLTPVEVNVDPNNKVTLPNIQFALGSSTKLANEDSLKQLQALAEAINGLPYESKFLIEGHTCSLGSEEENFKLSAERANSIRNFLISKGVPSARLQESGCGESEADKVGINENSPEFQLATYRKVMIHLIAN